MTSVAATPSARNGSDIVVETLETLGVTAVFGIPGQNALGLFDALNRSELRFISSRVENNAAFAADGFARSSDRPAVLFLSAGPGALTALSGLQEAYATGVPLLVLVAQVPTAGLWGARKGMLHQLDDQKSSAVNVTKSVATVTRAEQIPMILTDAWRLALTAPAGPVWVELPEDILLAPTSIPPVESVDLEVPQPAPRPELIRAAAEAINAAPTTVIVAGGGVRRAGAERQLLRLAERIGAPVISSPGGNGAFPRNHPLSLQSWVEDRRMTELLGDADVLLAIGTSLGEVTSNYFTLAPRGTVVQIDANVRTLGSNHTVLGIHSDATLAIDALLEHLEPRDAAAGEALAADALAVVRARLDAQDLALERGLIDAVREGMDDDAETFWDMTILGYWAWSAWDAREGGFHSAQGAGGLGFAFPAALGSAFATGRRTLAVNGDGGAMYSISELATAKQHGLPVTWLIVDDGGYGILREYMTHNFGKATATELARPDFVRLAESFGVPARRAAPEEVASAIRETYSIDGPATIVVDAKLAMFAATHIE